MAFTANNYIASGNDILSARFIGKNSYKASCPPQVSDTWTDANGGQHSEFYPYRILNVTFTTPQLTDEMLGQLITWFKSHYISNRCLNITAWCPDEQKYVTQICDVTFDIIQDTYTQSKGNIWQQVIVTLTGRGGTV